MTVYDETVSMVSALEQYRAARERALAFLLAAIDEAGHLRASPEPRVTHYRLPWALALCGASDAAFRLLAAIEARELGPDGAFHGDRPWDAAANRFSNTYPETVLAYGATLLRRFDLARRLMDFARGFQDQETGGIWSVREETGPEGMQLLFPTAQFGMSAVMTGDLDAALGVGRWLRTLWEAQPELPDRLYTIWTRRGGLATTVPDSDERWHWVNDRRQEREMHYNGGIAAAFLAHLGMATGDSGWLDLARDYQAFSMGSTERQFATKQVCKSAWGAGLLLMATGDRQYLPWVVRMGDWFVAEQGADGGWSNTPSLDPHPTLARRLEITAEFVVHLDTVIGAVSTALAREAAGRPIGS